MIPTVVDLKEKIFDIFDYSKDYETAREKRNSLLYSKETKWWFKKYPDLAPIKTMLEGFEFYRMTAYLRDKSLPRSSNSERMMREYRRMEKVRYGFGSQRTRENHLKIYQIRKYLNMDLEEFILTYAKK